MDEKMEKVKHIPGYLRFEVYLKYLKIDDIQDAINSFSHPYNADVKITIENDGACDEDEIRLVTFIKVDEEVSEESSFEVKETLMAMISCWFNAYMGAANKIRKELSC